MQLHFENNVALYKFKDRITISSYKSEEDGNANDGNMIMMIHSLRKGDGVFHRANHFNPKYVKQKLLDSRFFTVKGIFNNVMK